MRIRLSKKQRFLFSESKKGISLMETLIYMAITTMVLVFIVNMMMFSSKTFNNFKISRDIKNSAVISISRIVNEVKKAQGIDQISSSFNNSNGILALNMVNGDKIIFFLDSGIIKIENNGVIEGNLSLTNTFISSLIFRMIDNQNGNAIKIEMSVRDKENNFIKTENFYMTTISR